MPQSFDHFAADYDRFADLEPPHLRNWLLTKLPARGGRALDAGCGSGRHTVILAERFDDVVGIDISEPLVDIARRRRSRPNVRYQVADLRRFTDAYGFDLVFCSTTLHHVRDLEAALLHLRGLVRPGGQALLIDNVASRPTPSPRIHVLGAVRDFPGDVRRLGWRRARWLMTFRTGAPWLEHVASDRYLSRPAFERLYEAIFPGGRFHDLGYAHGLVWRNTDQATPVPGQDNKKPRGCCAGHEVRREP